MALGLIRNKRSGTLNRFRGLGGLEKALSRAKRRAKRSKAGKKGAATRKINSGVKAVRAKTPKQASVLFRVTWKQWNCPRYKTFKEREQAESHYRWLRALHRNHEVQDVKLRFRVLTPWQELEP